MAVPPPAQPRRAGQRASRADVAGNRALTLAALALFRAPFRDSQSGMWVLRRAVW
ncbi:MAG: hypothetical protein IRZ08_04950 [Frankia sp.]|nr:hypothetical protein [Frankia sp.]